MTATSAHANSETICNLRVQANHWNEAANAWLGAASELRSLLEHRGEKNYCENPEWLDTRNRAVYALRMKAVLLESAARGGSSHEYVWRAKVAP
jgi:hypothetical protein